MHERGVNSLNVIMVRFGKFVLGLVLLPVHIRNVVKLSHDRVHTFDHFFDDALDKVYMKGFEKVEHVFGVDECPC